MKYEIRRLVLSVDASLSIDKSEYDQLLSARRGLFEMLAIEEKYDLLVRSYMAFERVVHELALTSLINSESSWSDFIDYIQAVNFHLMNHLAMCRTYVDHMPQNLNGVFGQKSEQAGLFEKATNREYDSRLGYRVMAALRNYVQHCGLPIHSLTLGSSWMDDPGNSDCRHTAVPYLSVAALDAEGSFKKAVLAELSAIGSKVDARFLVRENMSSFGQLHRLVRHFVKPAAETLDLLIAQALNKFSIVHGSDLVGISAVEIDESGQVSNSASLIDDMIKRRKYLQTRNRAYPNLEKHFITGQIGV